MFDAYRSKSHIGEARKLAPFVKQIVKIKRHFVLAEAVAAPPGSKEKVVASTSASQTTTLAHEMHHY